MFGERIIDTGSTPEFVGSVRDRQVQIDNADPRIHDSDFKKEIKMGAVAELNDDNFSSEVLESSEPVLRK